MARVKAQIVLSQVGYVPPVGYTKGSLDNLLLGAVISASNLDDTDVVAREWILSPNVNTALAAWSSTGKNSPTFQCTPPASTGYGDAVLTLITYGKPLDDGTPNMATDVVVLGIRAPFALYTPGIPIPHPIESSGGGPVTIDRVFGREARVAEMGIAIAAVAAAAAGVPTFNGLAGPAQVLDSSSIVWTLGTSGGGRTATPRLQFGVEQQGAFAVRGAALWFSFAPATNVGALLTSRGGSANPLWCDITVNQSGSVATMATVASTGFVMTLADAALGASPANTLRLRGQNNTTVNGNGGNVSIQAGNGNGTGAKGIVTLDNALRFDINPTRASIFGPTPVAGPGTGTLHWGQGVDPSSLPGVGNGAFQWVDSNDRIRFQQGNDTTSYFAISDFGTPTNQAAFVSTSAGVATSQQLQTVTATINGVQRKLVILP